MISEAVSPLRRRMIEDMTIRQFGGKTKSDYIRKVHAFAVCLGRSPDRAEPEDLRRYQLHMASCGASYARMNLAATALRFFFHVTLGRSGFGDRMARIPTPERLPVVLSPEEVALLLAHAPSLKDRAALRVAYGCGLRVSEIANLIVAHDVTNVGSDRAQLAPMGVLAQEATGCETLTVLADRGYLNGDQVLACEGTGIIPCVPKTLTSGNAKRGLFTGQDFVYDAGKDHYTCPAGQHLTKGTARANRRGEIDHYRNLTACPACALKPRCTADAARRIKRWVHEGVLDAMQNRLDQMPDAMKIRRQTVEHPFGTLKAWMGATHFLTRTLAKVRTEMSLYVLAYNMKRMIQIFGTRPLIAAIRA